MVRQIRFCFSLSWVIFLSVRLTYSCSFLAPMVLEYTKARMLLILILFLISLLRRYRQIWHNRSRIVVENNTMSQLIATADCRLIEARNCSPVKWTGNWLSWGNGATTVGLITRTAISGSKEHWTERQKAQIKKRN